MYVAFDIYVINSKAHICVELLNIIIDKTLGRMGYGGLPWKI